MFEDSQRCREAFTRYARHGGVVAAYDFQQARGASQARPSSTPSQRLGARDESCATSWPAKRVSCSIHTRRVVTAQVARPERLTQMPSLSRLSTEIRGLPLTGSAALGWLTPTRIEHGTPIPSGHTAWPHLFFLAVRRTTRSRRCCGQKQKLKCLSRSM